MPRNLPGHLRLHVEDSPQVNRPELAEVPSLSSLCASFERTTGWQLLCGPCDDKTDDAVWTRLLDDADHSAECLLSVAPNSTLRDADRHESLWDEDSVCRFADSLADVLGELHRTRTELWRREAELAATVPVTSHPDEKAHIATRLTAVLRAGARSVHCQAAAAYLLDESTRELKLRSCWGLPKNRFLDSPRPLRGAAADLEALVGHAVVLEDTSLLQHWSVPEEFRSAVCVPISSPTIPLGTLWTFCDRPRAFTPEETNVLEIVAGRLASDLERESLLQQCVNQNTLNRQLLHAVQWQHSRLRIQPMLSGWQIAGRTAQADSLGGDFHDWFVLPDGTLAVVTGDAQGKLIEAALTSAAVHSAMKSHAFYRHTSQQMLERINETLWTASAGDQFASMFYAMIDPETGVVDHSEAGHIYAFVVGESVRPLSRDEPLPMGTQPDSRYPASTSRLDPGELLVVLTEGVKKALPDETSASHQLWQMLQNERERDAETLVDKAVSFVAKQNGQTTHDDQTILIVKRT